MLEEITIPDKQVTTFAKITTTEDIYFYGELSESYEKAFAKFKNESGINELSPSLSFLAHKNFIGFESESFQKVDFIPYTTTIKV